MTWTVSARWDSKEWRARPIKMATVLHPSRPKTKVGWEFVIDTGADRTLISPHYEEILQIPKRLLTYETRPTPTLAGEIKF